VKDPCAPCGLCCRSYLVPLFGHDVWWIATHRGLSPQDFVFVAEQDTPDPLGFRLAAASDAPTHGLALLKEEPMAPAQPCIFLTADEHGQWRCGIYSDRPITCQTYPMAKLGGRIYQREQTLCPPDSWNEDDLADPAWLPKLNRLRYRRDTYVEAVARWNAALTHYHPPGDVNPKMFCDYLLSLYEQIVALETSVGSIDFAAIELGWARVPPRPPESLATAELTISRGAEPRWVSHFRQVRKIIDGFFPALPPLPFQSIVVDTADG
jgi:Fe-S-cluster containining protein